MTCSDCHDPHERKNHRRLRADANDDKALCGSCHEDKATALAAHLDDKLAPGMGFVMSGALCTDCHMPKTAKTGAGTPGSRARG